MLSFILFLSLGGAQAAADATPTEATGEEHGRQQLICRSRPIPGSRIARQRVCKTREEWQLYEVDLEQSRRDINDRGMRGCPNC
jgi:hypothetical protein